MISSSAGNAEDQVELRLHRVTLPVTGKLDQKVMAQKLDEAGVKALASMPSLDELRGTIVGLVNAPATKVVRTILEPTSMLARVFGAYGAKEAA